MNDFLIGGDLEAIMNLIDSGGIDDDETIISEVSDMVVEVYKDIFIHFIISLSFWN